MSNPLKFALSADPDFLMRLRSSLLTEREEESVLASLRLTEALHEFDSSPSDAAFNEIKSLTDECGRSQARVIKEREGHGEADERTGGRP